MVKIPKDKRKGRKVLFRDASGRFVRAAERYQKAVTVQRLFRGKYVTVTEGKTRITPKRLVNLLTQDEFESLPANYSSEKMIQTTAKKYTAWDLANKLERERGVRGKVLRVTMMVKDGERMRRITFFRKMKRKGKAAYGFFRQMNEAIGNERMYLYNRISSKLFPDRKGKQVNLIGIKYSVEL